MAMNVNKHYVISILIFAVILISVAFSYTNVAMAEEIQLVYPNEGYLQAKNVDAIGVNDSLIVTADNENKIISYTGDACGNLDFDDIDDTVLKIFVFGHSAIVKGGKGFYLLSTIDGTLSSVDTAIANADSYLATDGTVLYVHQYGKVSVYGEDMSLSAEYVDKIFNNKPVLVVSGTKLLGFVVEHGVSRVYTYDTETSTTQNLIKDTVVKSAFAGATIFGFDGENIILIDKENIFVDDGALDYIETGLTEQNFTAFGDYLYIAKGEAGYDQYAYADGTLTFVGNHSYTGDGLDRLNTPHDAITLGGELVIADTLNNRLLYVGDRVSALKLPMPTSLAVAGERLYVLTSDGVVIVENKTIIGKISTDLELIDIAYSDGLYILAQDGVYLNIIGTLHKVFDVNGGKAMYVSDLYYILTDNGVLVAKSTSDGLEENEILSFEVGDYTPVDLACDLEGNVYILGDDNALHCYQWEDVIKANIDGFALAGSEILLESHTYNFTMKSMSVIGEKIVIATEENALVSVDNPMAKFKAGPSNIDKETALVGTYISTEKTYFMSNNNDGKTVLKVGAGMTFVCYESDGLLYTSFEGVKGFVFNVNKVTASSDCAGEYIAKNDIKLFVNPMTDSGVNVAKGTALTVVDDGGYSDGKWVRVEYNGKTYYTEMSGLELKSSPKPDNKPEKTEKPEKVSKNYGRAKSSRAGELVNLYSTTDSNMVVAQVTDGTRLEIVEKVGDFFKVIYNGNQALIHKDQFKLDGLTTVQIIAIVLSVVVVLAGGLIFMVTSLSKKKEENK